MDKLSPEQIAVLSKEDRGPMTRSIVIAFTIIAFICVCLRMFTRFKFVGRAIGWEDYTIIISMIFSVITSVFQVLQAYAGNGRHTMFVKFPESTILILKYLFWSIIFYNLSLCSTKISILLQYRRIFTVPGMRIPLNVVMAACVAYGIACFFTSIFSCVPVNAYWQILEQPKAKCIPITILWYVNAAFNILCDFLVAVLPVRVIWKLQIPMQQRVALMAILTIGWFICVVSILRLHTLIVLAGHMDDTTWHSAPIAYWSSIEMNLSIVCASLPALKPLFVNIIPGFSSRNGRSGYGVHSDKRTGQSFGETGPSAHSRRTKDDDMELELDGVISSKAYPSGDAAQMYGKNIYVTRQFQQHFEGDSDGESQRDLVLGDSQKDLIDGPLTASRFEGSTKKP